MMSVDTRAADYGAFMRNSMSATADLLHSIEQDIQESRQLIQTKNTDERALTRLVSSLEEDNKILMARVHTLEEELASLEACTAQSNDELYKEFEGKILACNGEIERVVAQCNDVNNERCALEDQLKQVESNYSNLSNELLDAKHVISEQASHIDIITAENTHLRAELQRSSEQVVALQQQQLQNAALLQQAQTVVDLAQQTSAQAAATHNNSGSVNLYSDDDIAGLLERMKQLEDENRQLLSASLAKTSSTSNSSLHAPAQGREQARDQNRVNYYVEQAPHRSSSISPAYEAVQQPHSPIVAVLGPRPSVYSSRYGGNADIVPSPVLSPVPLPVHHSPQHNPQHSALSMPSFAHSHTGAHAHLYTTATAPAVTAGSAPPAMSTAPLSPVLSSNNSGGGRRFESPVSDEGQPYELEEPLNVHTSHVNTTTAPSASSATAAVQYPAPKPTSNSYSQGPGVSSSPIASNGLYVTDYTFSDRNADGNRVVESTSAPSYRVYSPSRQYLAQQNSDVSEEHAPVPASASPIAPIYVTAPAPMPAKAPPQGITPAPVSAPVAASKAAPVYHDVLRSSAEVMAAARRTLHDSRRTREAKAAASTAGVQSKAPAQQLQAQEESRQQRYQQSQQSQQPNQQERHARQSLNSSRVRFASSLPATDASSLQSDSVAGPSRHTYHTPFAKAPAASSADSYDRYDSHLLPPHQQWDTIGGSSSPDDVPEYIAPYAHRVGGYDAYSSATEYNPMEHSLLRYTQPAAASPVISHRQNSAAISPHYGAQSAAEVAAFSPSSPHSSHSDHSANYMHSDMHNTQDGNRSDANDPVSARDEEGEEDRYTDDFESYDDNAAGYLDDERSLVSTGSDIVGGFNTNAGTSYDGNDYDGGSYRTSGVLGSAYGNTHDDAGDHNNYESYDIGADDVLEGSMSDNEMHNVFMCDGSSAVDVLAMQDMQDMHELQNMQDQQLEAYDLDELSRLDI